MENKEKKSNELLVKLNDCERKMDDLAWGIQTNEDFQRFSKWSKKAKRYRRAIAKLNAKG